MWDKRCDEKFNNDFADCELAWCSEGVARVFRYLYNGMLQGDMKNKDYRFHPTQKPTRLYDWILKRYAKRGDKILDTHVGSGASLIACHNAGMNYVGFEINENYYKEAKRWIENETAQLNIFDLLGGANDTERRSIETP